MSNKHGRQIAHAMRTAALKALARAYGVGGSQALEAAWLDLLQREGPGEFMKSLARFMPRALVDEEGGNVIHVVGVVPETPGEWSHRLGIGEEIIVDDGSDIAPH
jgi:hypothetical protein